MKTLNYAIAMRKIHFYFLLLVGRYFMIYQTVIIGSLTTTHFVDKSKTKKAKVT